MILTLPSNLEIIIFKQFFIQLISLNFFIWILVLNLSLYIFVFIIHIWTLFQLLVSSLLTYQIFTVYQPQHFFFEQRIHLKIKFFPHWLHLCTCSSWKIEILAFLTCTKSHNTITSIPHTNLMLFTNIQSYLPSKPCTMLICLFKWLSYLPST